MLFNSHIFIFLFFPLVLAGYYAFNYAKMYRTALVYLAGMSMWFYGYNNIYYLIILAASILINYGISSAMSRSHKEHIRKLCLCLGVLLNIGILFYFKYYDFFIENVNSAFNFDLPLLRLTLPLGISFYTFQQLSYVIDSYRHECGDYNFLEYAVYVSFFPQLIAGPIVYHSELIPQLRDKLNRKLSFVNLSKGLYAFALGLAKKVLIADTFSRVVNIGYDSIGELNATSAILVMVCYSLQIYFDFSGYCDMACGMGYMLNLKLPVNFNSPYKARSVTDFWDRWHMTLTRFFTRYIYIPLGGSRMGKGRTCVNVMIVFLVSGLWHGANWTFILWGALHGAISVFEKLFDVTRWKIPECIKICVTFILVTLAWSLFRAESLGEAGMLFGRLFQGGFGQVYPPITEKFQGLTEISFLYRAGLRGLMNSCPWLALTVFAAASLLACFTMKNTQEKVEGMSFNGRKILTVALLMFWSIMSLSEISEFLYFNF